MDAAPLLDPKNDAVFKRLFAGAPHLLAELINAVRHTEPPLTVVEILNPEIRPEELTGKLIVLDLLAKDPDGKLYNVEMQVRAHRAWTARSAYYLARAFAGQLVQGEDYSRLKPAIAIHLLDFALFDDQHQGIWCFELRDREQPGVRLGEELQFNVIELPKADRLGAGGPALMAWVAFLKHWQEEQRMNEINYPPVKEAMTRIRSISDDIVARHEALKRDMAAMDEIVFRREAREDGLAEGRAEGLTEGRTEGRAEGRAEGLAEGRAEGRAEGLTEGRAEGLAEGLAEGIAEGLAEGIAEGLAEGIAEGLAEGLAEGRVEGVAIGREAGLAEGALQGQAALLERQLTRRFGPLTETHRERLHKASRAELEVWADRVLEAHHTEAVFDS